MKNINESTLDFSGGKDSLLSVFTDFFKNAGDLGSLTLSTVDFAIGAVTSPLYGKFSEVNEKFEKERNRISKSINDRMSPEVKAATAFMLPVLTAADNVNLENLKNIPGIIPSVDLAKKTGEYLSRMGKTLEDKSGSGRVTFSPYYSNEQKKEIGKLSEEGAKNFNFWLNNYAVKDPNLIRLLDYVVQNPKNKITKEFNSYMNEGLFERVETMSFFSNKNSKKSETKKRNDESKNINLDLEYILFESVSIEINPDLDNIAKRVREDSISAFNIFTKAKKELSELKEKYDKVVEHFKDIYESQNKKTEENYYNDKDIINEIYLCSIEKFMFENKLERKI